MEYVQEYVKNFLMKSKTMTISTNGEKLWTTKIFYALDHGFIFLIEKTGLTLANVKKDPNISYSIDNNKLDLFVQGTGRVEILGEPKDFVSERGKLLYKVPEDSIFVKHGNVFIARLVPDKILVTDMRSEMKKFSEEIDLGQLVEKRHPLLKSARAWSFQQSLIAIVVGSMLALRIDLIFFILSVVGVLIAHASFNILNGYFDAKTGNDTFAYLGGSRVFVDKLVRENSALYLSAALFTLAFAIGIYLVLSAERVIPFLVIGIIAGLLYSLPRIGFKKFALGDAAVFLAWAPGIFLGGYVLQGGIINIPIILVSFSIGLLTVCILHGNNWRDIDDDTKVGVRTVASLIGPINSEYYYFALLWIPYFLILIVYFLVPSYYPLLAVMLTIPFAIKLSQIAVNRKNIKWGMLDRMTARVTLYFGLASIVPFIAVFAAEGMMHIVA